MAVQAAAKNICLTDGLQVTLSQLLSLPMRMENKFLELAINHFISFETYIILGKRPLLPITPERCEFVGASYKKLWHLLIDRGMKKRELCVLAGVSTSSLAKLGKGENVNSDILIKICRALDVGMDDIMDILPDEYAKNQGEGRQ